MNSVANHGFRSQPWIQPHNTEGFADLLQGSRLHQLTFNSVAQPWILLCGSIAENLHQLTINSVTQPWTLAHITEGLLL
jgi:hypothetical protein